MSTFVPGAELSRRLYAEVVRPLLSTWFPDLPHSAALLGRGSEVLGFDDAMSTDHDWKPRALVFLAEEGEARHGAAVREVLQQNLPATFAGHPTACEVHTVRSYIRQELELDITLEIEPPDWPTLPESGLRMLTSGVVFHDEVGLQAARDRLSSYPHDVWLYLLIAGWWRVHPEMNLVGRAGSAGDERGSSLIGLVWSGTSCGWPSSWNGGTARTRRGSGRPSRAWGAARSSPRSCGTSGARSPGRTAKLP
ncbi:DUF4037 domain-containing protein [Ornithinimicrobium cerasi]|uniref:DUF4037 domain-containing protein n=1 Tax=Ornithinimicrobium cerasi TaxID=2248773 RepID=UPI001F26E0A7|nr:DUF4037 domain-containing protein [Ornithinimicrobium cerasi]